MLLDLSPASQQQHEIDLEDDQQASNQGRLMQALEGTICAMAGERCCWPGWD
jgi:hypothetical protein